MNKRTVTVTVVLGITMLVLLTGCGAINLPPVANFTLFPSFGESPLTVSFDASLAHDPDGIIITYGWDFGDGTTGTGVSTSHTFITTSTRTFIVTLTVTDDKGTRTSTSRSITVKEAPTVHYRVTVRQITDEFYVNEYAATTKYTGKYIAVSGYVQSIGIGLIDLPFVVLVGHPEDSVFAPAVHCSFTKTGPHPGLAELRRGDHVTIIAKFRFYSSLFRTVYLEKSRIE